MSVTLAVDTLSLSSVSLSLWHKRFQQKAGEKIFSYILIYRASKKEKKKNYLMLLF